MILMVDVNPLYKLADSMNTHNCADWDTVGGVTGDEGVGKTDLLITLGLIYEGLTIDQIIHPSKEDLVIIETFFRNQMLYVQNAQEIERVIEGCPQYSFIGVDEGMMILYKYEHGTKRQRKLNKYFATCRKNHNNAVFFCMQDFNDFTKFFRNRRIKLWIHIVNRGQAILMTRSSNPVSEDKWNMELFSKLYDKSDGSLEGIASTFANQKYHNFVCTLYWDKLPKVVRDLYDKIRFEIKEKFGELENEEIEADEDKNIWKTRWIKIIAYLYANHNNLLNQTKIAEVCGMQPQRISQVIVQLKKESEEQPI